MRLRMERRATAVAVMAMALACGGTNDPSEGTSGDLTTAATSSSGRAHSVANSGDCHWSDWTFEGNLNPSPANAGINGPNNDYQPAISPDGLSLYFVSDRTGSNTGACPDGSSVRLEDIWFSRRAGLGDPWPSPQPLPSPNINTEESEWGPNISPDGHWLLFTRRQNCVAMSERNAPSRIYVSHREDVADDLGWEPAVPLGGEINDSGYDSNAPRLFVDQERGIVSIYFNSLLRGPYYGGLGDYDEYVSKAPLINGGLDLYKSLFPVGDDVAALNSPSRDTPTAVSEDGLEMFIASQRAGTSGGNDLWVSTREHTRIEEWSAPVNLGPTINTASNDGGPALSSDGTTLYFNSTRSGGAGGQDLYFASRTRLCGDD